MNTVLLYVNSQFGIGHFQRCFCILRELELYHPDVNPILLYGGVPHSGFDELVRTKLVPLPGLTFHRSDEKIGYEPRPVDAGRKLEHVLNERRQLICDALENEKVDVLLLEYFPFSKQSLAPEVEYLITEAGKVERPVCVSSVRDFMTIDDGFSRSFTHSFIDKYCSYLLVHADPMVAEFQTTYGDISNFSHKIRYTGYVVDTRCLVPSTQSRKNNVVAVSVGGGKDGESLFHSFFKALTFMRREVLDSLEFRLFPGPFLPERVSQYLQERISELKADAIRICSFTEYRQTILECAASISMCGYNTAAELASLQVPCIWFLPRDRTEQLVRAKMLGDLGIARVVNSLERLAESLQTLNQTSASVSVQSPAIDFNGAARTAEILRSLACGHSIE